MSDYMQALNDKHDKIVNNLQELQAVETYLFQKINDANKGTRKDGEELKIKRHIEELSKTRLNLLGDLQNLYSGASDEAKFNSSLLGNQTVMGQQLAAEIKKAENEKKKLIAEKNNKQRLAQIGEFEYSKNSEHKSILKAIVYGSFLILLVIFFNSNNLIPDFLTKILVVIISVVVIFNIGKRMLLNFKRNNIDYTKFDFQKKKEEVFDKETENTMDVSKLLGLKCEDTTDSEELAENANATGSVLTDHSHSDEEFNLDNGYLNHAHDDESEHGHRIRVGGSEARTQEEEMEGFSLLNANGCKSCKNVFPSNVLKNQAFKNTSLNYTMVN